MHRPTDFVQDVLKLGRLREGTLPLMTGDVRGQLVSTHLTYGATIVHRNLLTDPNL
jgi:hypothetical protein